jgi:hypothetical protein
MRLRQIRGRRARADQIDTVVGRVREMALRRLRKQIAIAFDDDPHGATTDQLSRFALAAFDGAFIASHTDPGTTLQRLLQPLAPAIVAAHRSVPAAG